MTSLAELQAKRSRIWADMAEIAERNQWTADDKKNYDTAERELTSVSDEIEAHPDARERAEDPAIFGNTQKADSGITLRHDQSFTDWAKANGQVRTDNENLRFGKIIRGMVTGDWKDAEKERRALAEGTDSAGGFTVPSPLSTKLIDKARNATSIFKAGAVTVPMTSDELKIARLAGDPSAAWRLENAVITDSDLTFEEVKFTARSLAVLVRASRELIEDSYNADQAIEKAFAETMAIKLDYAALYGSGTAPEPKGVKNLGTGLNTVSMGTNGAALTNYDKYVDAIAELWTDNHNPTGIIQAPRTEASIAKLKATDNQPMNAPKVVDDLPRFTTNQVPVNLTQGTATNASDAFVANWAQLMVGIRSGIRIELLKERYADNLQYGFLCFMRADVQVAHPEGFCVIQGITP